MWRRPTSVSSWDHMAHSGMDHVIWQVIWNGRIWLRRIRRLIISKMHHKINVCWSKLTPKKPLPSGLWMSLESNNHVVTTQQTLLFSPVMHLFRNHYCLCTMGANVAAGALLPREAADPRTPTPSPSVPNPLGNTYTYGQGEDLLDP